MEIKTTIAKLGAISFTLPNTPVQSLLEQLYTKKPERGGAKVAYRIAALRGAVVRLLGPESAYDTTRLQLVDAHHESAEEFEARKAAFIEANKADIEAGKATPPESRAPKSVEDAKAFQAGMMDLNNTEVSFDGELVTLDQLDAAGYTLSGIEIDALMGLLIQPGA